MVPLFLTFHWMWEDERWRYKWLFQSLILLIPVVGQIALLGWLLTMCENLSAGIQIVPPAGLYLRRGVQPLLIAVFYWFGLSVPFVVLRYYEALWGGALQLGQVAAIYNYVALLLYVVLLVPLLIATDRGGILGGLNLVSVALSVFRRPLRTLVAAVVVLVALAICLLGFALLIVPAPFFITYAGSVVATIGAWWYRPRLPVQPERPDVLSPPTGPHVPFRPPGVEPSEG